MGMKKLFLTPLIGGSLAVALYWPSAQRSNLSKVEAATPTLREQPAASGDCELFRSDPATAQNTPARPGDSPRFVAPVRVYVSPEE
jgi:hypothetical protein